MLRSPRLDFFTALLLLTPWVTPTTRSQTLNQNSGKPTGSPTTGTSIYRNPKGRNPTPAHTTSGGGHTGAIVGGTAGAAAAGIALYELLHHAHPPESGKSVERLNLTLRYPEDWQLNQRLNLRDDPISLNNFNSSYLRGGIIPVGGADIDVARFPATSSAVSELIASDLSDADEMRIDPHSYRVGGRQGTRVLYSDTYTPSFAYENVAIYVSASDGLYKFFLTYHRGDPHRKGFNEDFEYLLKSVRFQQ